MSQTDPAAALARSAIGAMFFALFGGVWIAIFIVGNVLKNLGLQAWFIPAVMLIVGLLFFPLA